MADYVVGDDVQINYEADIRGSRKNPVSSAVISLWDPSDNQHLNCQAMVVSGHLLTYLIDGSEIDEAGTWSYQLTATFANNQGDKTIPIQTFTVAAAGP